MAKRSSKVPAKSGYTDTRFNATKYGILSRHTVLPWEDSKEYRELHEALIAEYTPDGPTEGHLVEEVAGIMWRKQRLRMAEAGAARDALGRIATERGRLPRSLLRIFELYENKDDRIDSGLLALVSIPPDQIEEELVKIKAELNKNETEVEGDDLKQQLLEQYREVHEAAQADVASGATYEKIARYETQLDRKLERTLTMLLRIQEFRNRPVALGSE